MFNKTNKQTKCSLPTSTNLTQLSGTHYGPVFWSTGEPGQPEKTEECPNPHLGLRENQSHSVAPLIYWITVMIWNYVMDHGACPQSSVKIKWRGALFYCLLRFRNVFYHLFTVCVLRSDAAVTSDLKKFGYSPLWYINVTVLINMLLM